MSVSTESTNSQDNPLIFEYVESAVNVAGNVNDFALKPISASEAFRKYSWLTGSPVLNKSGNLRGMVINARMRTVYNISSTAGDKLALLSMLIEVGKEMSRIRKVYDTDMDGGEKAARILLLGSAGILRAVTSVVPTAFHLGSMVVQGYAQLISLLSGSSTGTALSDKIASVDAQVSAIHRKQWDGETWYHVIEATVRR